jgi:outer membrane protein assembly factor BamB
MSELAAGKGKDAIAWFRDDLGSDVPTPSAVNGRVYLAGDKGLVSALDIETGNTLWQLELPKSRVAITSSPLVAGNHLYITREDATTYVIGPLDQSQPELLSTNELADSEPFTVASLVPLDNGFLLRSKTSLYRLGE